VAGSQYKTHLSANNEDAAVGEQHTGRVPALALSNEISRWSLSDTGDIHLKVYLVEVLFPVVRTIHASRAVRRVKANGRSAI
jgi:hypothetical protein